MQQVLRRAARGSPKKRKRAAADPDNEFVMKEDVSSEDEPSSESPDLEDLGSRLGSHAKGSKITADAQVVIHARSYHSFTESEITQIRKQLLEWYDATQREMPWRRPSPAYFARLENQDRKPDHSQVYCDDSPYDRAYAVLVSELMLQQTQVSTVRDYFRKWMAAFPSVHTLASASLEEVNQVWAGLGYYRRAKLLHECAKEIVSKYDGKVPGTVKQLLDLPGIGPYTAGAISSIAFNTVSGIVDGNVIRVISRLRAIEADPKPNNIQKYLWAASEQLVDPIRPGDFNQALMEFGAIMCTPKNPKCSSCPVSSHCSAFAQVQGEPIPQADGENCSLCTSATPTDSVTKYPVKVGKKPPRTQITYTTAIQRTSNGAPEFLVVQRPSTGLLAGMWEFPSIDRPLGSDEKVEPLHSRAAMFDEYLRHQLGWDEISIQQMTERKHLGEVSHLFSHIKQTIILDVLSVSGEISATSGLRSCRWLPESELVSAAVSKSVHKAVALLRKRAQAPSSPKKLKADKSTVPTKSTQRTILSMFQK